MEHPKCLRCGGESFRLVEDVPRLFRDHVFIDGVLYFNADDQEMAWDDCANRYQHIECCACGAELEDVEYEFDDSMQREADAIGEMT